RSADMLSVGGSFERDVQASVERGLYPETIGREGASLAEKTNWRKPAEPHEQLLEGRCYLIEEKRTSEGGLISLQIDITEIKKHESSAVDMAVHDASAPLPNPHVLTERMHAATTCAHRGERMALLLLDLDNFKTINGT